MAKLNIVLVDSDNSYLESLWRYTQLTKSVQVMIAHKFTSRDTLETYLEQRKKGDSQEINVLLVKPEMVPISITTPKGLDSVRIDMVVLLINNQSNEQEYSLPWVNKYSPADVLLYKITELYLSKKQINHGIGGGSHQTTCLAFFSPSAGAGKTTLSMALAKTLVSQKKRVVYLNLESNSGLNVLLPNNQGIGISQLLVYIQDEEDNSLQSVQKIREAVIHNDKLGFDYIPLFDKSFDIVDVSSKDIQFLTKAIIDMGSYDFLLIDMESSLNQRTISVLEHICDNFIWICGSLDENIHYLKSKQLETDVDNLTFERSRQYIEKCIPVINRYRHGEIEILGKPVSVKIPYVKTIFDLVDSFIDSEDSGIFWRGIEQLTTVVTKQGY
ncbi:MAG: hypothetical protein APF81_16705 [Desulfosporosinus sp. BRH_c37]|nr:MAG: hypothetical protein APF81_16705 [Desulfosporosinus sp. BRH_c37]